MEIKPNENRCGKNDIIIPLISVIIATYNRCKLLERVLYDLKNLECDGSFDFEIIVVDNNSTDKTKETVQKFAEGFGGRLKYIFEETQGKSYAINRGIEEAQGEIIAFTDDDVIVDRRWLKEINSFFILNDCIGIGGKVLPVWPRAIPDWVFAKKEKITNFGPIVIHDYGENVLRYTKEICPPVGCNMAFRKSVFEKYGKFNVEFGKSGGRTFGEDTEFCLRLRGGGEKLYFVPQVLIYHPVEERRLTKKYFIRWFFYSGRTIVKMEQVPAGTFCIFYIPAYMYKKLLGKITKLFFAIFFNKKEIFKHIFSLSYNWGQACELFLINMPKLKWKVFTRTYSK